LTYFNFNLFSYTNISGNISYTRRVEGIKNNTNIIAINQVSSPVNLNSNFPDETVSAFGRFSKRVKKIEFIANANVAYVKSNNIIQSGPGTGSATDTQNIRTSESFTQNYRGSVRSNFKEWPNFEVGYALTLNDYDNGGLEQTFYTHQPFANVDVRFLKDFTFDAEWNYYNYTNKDNTVDNSYSFVNANLYYQKGDSPWEFSIRGTNLLNTEFLNNDSFNDQFNTTSQYFVLPRIMMLVVRYNL